MGRVVLGLALSTRWAAIAGSSLARTNGASGRRLTPLRRLPLGLLLLAAAPAAAHDWYEDLASPRGERCCTGRDCQPVDHRYNPATRRLEVGIEGSWVPVDPGKLVAVPSPDGAAHACFERRWTGRRMALVIRCVILPGEA